MPIWTWIETRGVRHFPKVAASSDHRLLWGWLRLVLGLTQMAFTVAALLLIGAGIYGRGIVAASLATAATIASRHLFAGRPDPRLEASLDVRASIEAKGGGANRGE
jgi:hypothetical protein